MASRNQINHTTPLSSGISCVFDPPTPTPSAISNSVHGGGMDILRNHTIKMSMYQPRSYSHYPFPHFIYLFVYLFIYLFIYLIFNYSFIYLFIHLFMYLCIYLFIYLYIYIFIHLFIYF